MKRNVIIAVVLMIFGLALASSEPAPGIIIFLIGLVLILRSRKKKGTATKNQTPGSFTCHVAGISSYQDNIRSFMVEQPSFKSPRNKDKRAYRYVYFEKDCELVPEPSHPHDKDAIQVMYAGTLVGYIPANDCKNVAKMMQTMTEPPKLTIKGGGYKEFDGSQWVEVREDFRGEVSISFRA